MKIKCPECNIISDAPDTYVGREVRCPECKESFEASGDVIVFDVLEAIPESVKKNPNGLLGLISFLIPLAGIIIGSIFISKPNKVDRDTGEHCFALAILGFIVGVILLYMLL